MTAAALRPRGRLVFRASGWTDADLYRVGLPLIVLLGLALRLFGLGAVPLNFDEGATSYFAHLPFAVPWGARAVLETNPPLFYSLERCVGLALGGGAFGLRLLPAIAGALAVPVAAFLARRLGGAPAGLAAGLLVATSPLCLATSQDARTYSLLTLAALLAIAAELRLVEAYAGGARRQGRWWAIYVGAAIAAIYLHNTAVVMVLALNLTAAAAWLGPLRRQPRVALHWAAANTLIAGAFAFWLPVVVYQSVHTLAHFWLPTPSLTDLRYAMMTIYAQPMSALGQPLPDLLFVAAGVAGLVLYRSRPLVAGLAICVLAGVPVLSWAISQWRPILNGKTLLWLVPLFLVFVALGCTWVRRLAVPLTLVLVLVQAVACGRDFATRADEAYPDVAALLRAEVRPGDAIYLDGPFQAYLLGLHDWPRDRLTVYAPAAPDPWFRDFDGGRKEVGEIADLAHGPRLWVLTRADTAVQLAVRRRLGSAMSETQDYVFGHGQQHNQPVRNLELSLFVSASP